MAEKTTGPIERELRIRNDELRARIEQLTQANATLTEANAEYAKRHVALLAENQRLRADGERLDWLDALGVFHLEAVNLDRHGMQLDPQDLRSAIDAARGEK